MSPWMKARSRKSAVAARKERDARERAAREVQRYIRGEMRAAILAVGDRRFDALIPEERKAEGVRVLAESPTDAGSGHPDGVLPPSFQESWDANLELLKKISEQLQALSHAKLSEQSLRVRADRWADSVPRSAEAAESSLAGDASLDRDRHSGRDEDSSSPVLDQLQAKPGWAAALQTLIDAERKGIEVFIISKPELVGSVKQLLRHDASPSVGAPDGAGVGTPTVGGGVKSSVTVPDAPPTPESGSAPVLTPPLDVAHGSSEVAPDGVGRTPIQAHVNLVYALRYKLEDLDKFLRDGGELPAVDLVGPFGPVDDLLGLDGESGDVLGSAHDASPSVGAPHGAGVGTPTVGAEEGGASGSPADAPPTPSTTSPRSATEGEVRA